jgi:cytosine/adenosine deaminase-related metal-dependent hydrolase
MTSPAPVPASIRARIVADGVATERTLLLADGLVAESIAAGVPRYAVDLPGHLVFPALVNAHDHLQLNAFARPDGIGLKANSYDWIDALRPRLDEPAVKAVRRIPSATRAWHGGLKNLLSGTLLVAHHDPWEEVFDAPDFPVDVLSAFGWSHSLGLADRYGPSVAGSFAATPPANPWFIHLAEGVDAVAAAELSRLEDLGAFGPNGVFVHGLGLAPADVARVVERGAGVVWCPSSNLFMFGRTLDPAPLAANGALALGTDSRLTGAFDLLSELRTAAANGDLSPLEILRLATSSAARLLRAPGAGGLAPAQRADLVVLRDPGGDPSAALLSATRADLRAVIRRGAPVLADPDFAGWFEAAGVPVVAIRLDGHPKLCAASALRLREAVALEPGLVVESAGSSDAPSAGGRS